MTDVLDSIRLVDQGYVNRIHHSKPSGKLHKGHNITAATSSIPSKYQTIVIDNSERKGFLAKSKRFTYESEANDHPGPGNYMNSGSIEKISTSFSKKGTGGFASKDRRIRKHDSTFSPGSGAYGLPSLLSTQNNFNKAQTTSVFHKPIAQVDTDKKVGQLPAPNQYDVLRAKLGKENNVSAGAAFKSRTQRQMINTADARTKPAPWQYHVNEELVRDSVKVPFSSFKSKSKRQMSNDPVAVPGPGTYHPHEEVDPVSKTLFPRKHYLCISAPAMPLPKTPPSPGPGSYEMTDFQGPTKHYMSSNMFVSTTSRWTADCKNPDFPGPAHYRPAGADKQSFIYNAASRWI